MARTLFRAFLVPDLYLSDHVCQDGAMTDNDTFYKELDCVDREDLAKAAGRAAWRGVGEERYSFYRRKGYCPDDAFHYALNWCRNAAEQAARRKDHMTGCPA